MAKQSSTQRMFVIRPRPGWDDPTTWGLPLTELGVEQVVCVGEKPRAQGDVVDISRIVTSPFLRYVETTAGFIKGMYPDSGSADIANLKVVEDFFCDELKGQKVETEGFRSDAYPRIARAFGEQESKFKLYQAQVLHDTLFEIHKVDSGVLLQALPSIASLQEGLKLSRADGIRCQYSQASDFISFIPEPSHSTMRRIAKEASGSILSYLPSLWPLEGFWGQAGNIIKVSDGGSQVWRFLPTLFKSKMAIFPLLSQFILASASRHVPGDAPPSESSLWSEKDILTYAGTAILIGLSITGVVTTIVMCCHRGRSSKENSSIPLGEFPGHKCGTPMYNFIFHNAGTREASQHAE